MNERTEQLVRELAEKLGTTADHLWAVLVRQAPITSTVRVCILGLVALALLAVGVMALRAFRRRRFPKAGDISPEALGIFFWCVACGVFVIGTLTSLPIIIAGFANPEYWALQEVMRSLK